MGGSPTIPDIPDFAGLSALIQNAGIQGAPGTGYAPPPQLGQTPTVPTPPMAPPPMQQAPPPMPQLPGGAPDAGIQPDLLNQRAGGPQNAMQFGPGMGPYTPSPYNALAMMLSRNVAPRSGYGGNPQAGIMGRPQMITPPGRGMPPPNPFLYRR